METSSRTQRLLIWLTALIAMAATPSCNSIDDDAIPSVPVQIVFNDVGVWDRYGVAGALDCRYFIKETRQPSGFFYTATTYTGWGGVLLVGDIYGEPRAYDLSCPVEHAPDVRIAVDNDTHQAVCPKCGSVYDVFENYGYPLSGPAAKRGLGLKLYHVYPGNGSTYRVITR